MEILQQYIIRPETMALLPCSFVDGSLGTLVIEENAKCCVTLMPKRIVEDSCGYYGSTYRGRKKVAMDMGYKSMPPICVCGELGIIFISSMTERSDYCAWLAFMHVHNWNDSNEKGYVSVLLSRDKEIKLPMNSGPFSGRMLRAMQYSKELQKRMRSNTIVAEPKEESKPQSIILKENGTYYVDIDGDDLVTDE
ncbi:competence protein ComK [Sporolactobacillus sp. STCC-11]|uniref:competence protein ComK n=1 Tax=Sporolactobacillus caesalpiniae TaxID=3230362 RepID=UPI00339114FC